MADIYGAHFTYNGTSSRDLGLILVNVTSERVTSLSGSVKGLFIFDKRMKNRYLISNDYSESPMSFEIDIVTDDQQALTKSQCRQAEKWLFNKPNFYKLYIDQEDDCDDYTTETIDGIVKRLFLKCRFINASRIDGYGGVVGYHATIETDTGFWWQDEISKTFETGITTTTGYKSLTVETDTDINDYIYPKITFTTGALGGTVVITNRTDDTTRETKLINLPAESTIVIDSRINFLGDNLYSLFNKRNFPRLLDGTNTVRVKGNVLSITFEYSNQRFL